ncbi:DNA polymerase III subunit chi [Motiliproteus sp.]|uniref:DNA polymerase III subunit chi n=1 Tax=Motiliproteus sp. TaxID=1898955 RepID=UPI003BACC3BE
MTTAESNKRSDFYVLPTEDPDARRRFLCKVLEKVVALGHRIYIRTDDETQARQLDEWLWDYQPEAFLPHSLLAAGLNSPIEIGYGDSKPDHREVFVNLALEIDELALEFNRTIEIVVQQTEILEATRANYRRYQGQGYEIHMNDMRRKG